jgi:hypothetical protein
MERSSQTTDAAARGSKPDTEEAVAGPSRNVLSAPEPGYPLQDDEDVCEFSMPGLFGSVKMIVTPETCPCGVCTRARQAKSFPALPSRT